MRVTMIPIAIIALGRLGKSAGGVKIRKTSRDHPNYSIVKIDQNTWRPEETCFHSDSTIANLKNSQSTIKH